MFFRKGNFLRGEVEKLNLKAEYVDSSLLREKLTLEVFQDFGIPTPSIEPVRFYINDEFYGVMMEYEEADDKLLERNGLNPDGYLVKTNYPDLWQDLALRRWIRPIFYEGVVGGEIAYEAYIENFVRNLNTLPTEADRVAFVEQNLNVDLFLDFLVARALTSWYDQEYANRLAYLDAETPGARWIILPWDADHSFGWNAEYLEYVIQPPLFYDMPAIDPVTPIYRVNPLFTLFETHDPWRDEFFARLRTALDTTFTEQQWIARIDELFDLIEADALRDTLKKGDNAVFLSERENLKNFVRWRRRWLQEFEMETEALRAGILGRRDVTAEFITMHDENGDQRLDMADLILLINRLMIEPFPE
jgi:spore coat protein H